MRTLHACLCVALLTGCASEESGVGAGGGGGGADASTTTTGAGGGVQARSGRFAGTYDVPVPPELEAAATYPVAEIDWAIEGGRVRLDYDLPLGLVGKELHVSFDGPLDAGGTSARLTGGAGTAECTIGPSRIVCHETMYGLQPIDVDLAVVEEIARAEYDGPVADRLDVARRFSGDPIGIAHVDLDAPVE